MFVQRRKLRQRARLRSGFLEATQAVTEPSTPPPARASSQRRGVRRPGPARGVGRGGPAAPAAPYSPLLSEFQDVLLKVIRYEGFFSLWKGFTPYYARLGPHTVLTFIFLEQMNTFYKKFFLSA
ncbi:hypothetical protein KIL84_020618 [Mauremys mutica]|uniref:Mitochondrial 2-oxoglutarate/malate carrier protein n=1 Tax=Mauremys mutica TaxID=74926 RepID=A0A9D3XXR0_9SAUR|nr:hypothetical protein KIL84_020618 [Mauremys mutica]